MLNGSGYFSAFPFAQSEALAGPGPSSVDSGGGGTFSDLQPLSSPGAGVSPGATGSALTPSAGYSEELFGYTLAEYEGPIVKVSNPSDASGWRAFAKVAGRNFKASRMAVSILDWGGTSMRLGLFDAEGNILTKTAPFVGANNTVFALDLLASVQLMGSQPYYLGYWSNDNTGNLKMRCVSGRSTSDRAPLMQRNDINEAATNLGGDFDMMTQYRPWLMVME